MSTRARWVRGSWRVLQTACTLLVLFLAAGCASGDGSADDTATSTLGSSEKSVRSPEMRELGVQRISSGEQGLEQRRIVAAPSAAALSQETGMRVSGAGDGVYVAAFWGRKTTGGYSVAVESARLEGEEITIRLALRQPPPDAFVAQVITYPYAVAVLRGADLEGKKLVAEREGGGELDWPVRIVGGSQ